MDFFRNFDFPRTFARAVTRTTLGLELHPLNGQRAHAQGIAEGGGDHFEFINPLGIGLLMHAVKRSYALILQIFGYTFVRRKHELFDEAMGYVALRAGNAL